MRSSPRWRAPTHKQDFKPCWTEAFTNQETWNVVLAITSDGLACLTWPGGRSWINVVTPGEASTRRHCSHHTGPRSTRRRGFVASTNVNSAGGGGEEGNGTRPGRRAPD